MVDTRSAYEKAQAETQVPELKALSHEAVVTGQVQRSDIRGYLEPGLVSFAPEAQAGRHARLYLTEFNVNCRNYSDDL